MKRCKSWGNWNTLRNPLTLSFRRGHMLKPKPRPGPGGMHLLGKQTSAHGGQHRTQVSYRRRETGTAVEYITKDCVDLEKLWSFYFVSEVVERLVWTSTLKFHRTLVPCKWGDPFHPFQKIICLEVVGHVVIIIILKMIMIIILTMTLTGIIGDFVQSPHCAANCLQHVHSSVQGAVVYKSCATHWALIACSMPCTTWYEGTV